MTVSVSPASGAKLSLASTLIALAPLSSATAAASSTAIGVVVDVGHRHVDGGRVASAVAVADREVNESLPKKFAFGV